MRVQHLRKRVMRRFAPAHRAWWTLTLAMIAAFGCLTYWFVMRRSSAAGLHPSELNGISDRNSSADSLPAAREMRAKNRLTGRAFYAHSIVPHGIASIAELKAAMAGDPVVSAEYSKFRLRDAHIFRLNRDLLVHVSYRVGDRIFWTKRKLKLAKGETLITDGTLTARTKCGNLISEKIDAPVSPNEPTESEFNTPIAITYNPGDPVSDDRFSELAPPSPARIAPLSYDPPTTGIPWSGGGAPFIPFVPPGGYTPGSSVPRVINTPEPGTGFQFLLALPAILFLLWRSKSKRTSEGARRTP